MGIMEAARRANATYVKVFATDVLQAMHGDAARAEAIEYGSHYLRKASSAKNSGHPGTKALLRCLCGVENSGSLSGEHHREVLPGKTRPRKTQSCESVEFGVGTAD